jgi:hypothetical protein
VGERLREPAHRVHREVVEHVTGEHVVARRVAGEDAQAAPLDQQRCGVPRGDEVAADADVHHVVPVLQRQGPEGPAPEGQRVAVAGVGHQEVEPAVLGADAGEQGLDGGVVGVVEGHRDAPAAAVGQLLGGVLDGAGQR